MLPKVAKLYKFSSNWLTGFMHSVSKCYPALKDNECRLMAVETMMQRLISYDHIRNKDIRD